MSVSIELREIGDVAVIDVTGESSIMDGAILQQTVKRLTREGKRLFIFNLSGLRHLDSFGLGQMVASYISVRDQRGHVRVVNPAPSVGNMFRYTRIDTILQVVPTEDEAVRELQKLSSR